MTKKAFLPALLLTIFSVCSLNLSAQQEENVWIFGDHAGLDFNNGAPVAVQSAIEGFGEANASVCDKNGQLLFYTEGTIVWDRMGHVMPNGNDLIGSALSSYTITSSTCQGALIVPMPDDESKYYIFSLTAIESGMDHLYYSVVDMDLNGGFGDVVPAQQGILIDSSLSEKMTAVVGDRCNVWLLVRSRYNTTFKAFSITSSGIDLQPQESSIGMASFAGAYTGSMVFSPDRKKLALSYANFPTAQIGGIELFDFDPATGMVSNPLVLDQASGYYGGAFSPDNSKLYGSSRDSLYQFDLSIASPEATKAVIGPSPIAHLKLASDGKIYTRGSGSFTHHLSVINAPDLSGAACDFEADEVALLPNTTTAAGLTNVVPVIPHDTFYTQQDVVAPCFGTDFSFTAGTDSSGWDFVWSTGSTEATISVDVPGTYWVSYRTPPCNFHTDTFHISFPNGVLPAITTSAACTGSSNGYAFATTYPGDPVSYYYTWMSGSDTLSQTDSLLETPAGSYSLYVQTNTGCDTLLYFDIAEVDFEVSFSLSDTLICTGAALQFQNTSDEHFTQFTWHFGDGDSSLLQHPEAHAYLQPGSYEIILSGSGPICSDTTQQTVLVDPAFAMRFDMEPGEICAGDHITFTLPAADSTLTGLHWSFGDGTAWSSGYEAVVQHAYDQAGLMPVQVQAQFRACPDTSFTDTVRVYALPEVALGGDTSICLDGPALVLRNLAGANNDAYHYLWNTGDTTATIRVLQPGSYSLRVSTEPLGCTTTDAIEVTKDCYTDVPNAFTPNGDGDNDYFFPRTQLSQSISNFRMQILNRWGQLVFETTSIDGRGWDGRFNDQEQPMGVYIYVIEVGYTNGRQETYKGNVTLLR